MNRSLIIFGLVALVISGLVLVLSNIKLKSELNNKLEQNTTEYKDYKPLKPKQNEPQTVSDAIRRGIKPQSKVTLLELGGFLDSHQNNPLAFATAYDLTSDSEVLHRALKRWPNSFPLLARLLTLQIDQPQQKSTIEAIMNTSPNNSFGFYAMANFLLKEGKTDDAYALMAEAAKKSPPEYATTDDMLMRRAAWESTGATSLDAKLKSLDSDSTTAMENVLLSLTSTANSGKSSLPSKSDQEMANIQLIGYFEHIRQSKYRSVQEEAICLSGQLRSFDAIDPEMEFGDTGMSVSQYRSKIDFELSSLVKFSAGLNKVFSAMSDAELSAYADRWLSLGEVSAMRDLMKRIQ